MICEGDKPNYFEVIENAEVKKVLVCKHDFWEKAGEIDFGDIVLCQRCSQYFTKVRNMPWLIRSKTVDNPAPGIRRMTLKPQKNHKDWSCMVRVPVRITDDKD